MKTSDTTVKIDGLLIQESTELLEEGQTLTGFVRDAVRAKIRRAKMKQAALIYQQSILSDPEECAEMEEWGKLALAASPKPKNNLPRRARK